MHHIHGSLQLDKLYEQILKKSFKIVNFFDFKFLFFKTVLSREKKITSVECVRVVIDRIREIDSILTCVVDSRYQDAIRYLLTLFHQKFVTFKMWNFFYFVSTFSSWKLTLLRIIKINLFSINLICNNSPKIYDIRNNDIKKHFCKISANNKDFCNFLSSVNNF